MKNEIEMDLEKQKTLDHMANLIWERGETHKNNLSCTNPDLQIYKSITQDLENLGKEPITHYVRKWEQKGKSVRLNLYTSPAYGAVLDKDLKSVATFVIMV